MSPAARRESGMTLVEVLVSVALLALVAIGLMSLLVTSIRQNKLAEMRSVGSPGTELEFAL